MSEQTQLISFLSLLTLNGNLKDRYHVYQKLWRQGDYKRIRKL